MSSLVCRHRGCHLRVWSIDKIVPFCSCSLQHPIRIFHAGCHRFFAEYAFNTCVRCIDNKVSMPMVGSCNRLQYLNSRQQASADDLYKGRRYPRCPCHFALKASRVLCTKSHPAANSTFGKPINPDAWVVPIPLHPITPTRSFAMFSSSAILKFHANVFNFFTL